jgi:hypothetical protein
MHTGAHLMGTAHVRHVYRMFVSWTICILSLFFRTRTSRHRLCARLSLKHVVSDQNWPLLISRIWSIWHYDAINPNRFSCSHKYSLHVPAELNYMQLELRV